MHNPTSIDPALFFDALALQQRLVELKNQTFCLQLVQEAQALLQLCHDYNDSQDHIEDQIVLVRLSLEDGWPQPDCQNVHGNNLSSYDMDDLFNNSPQSLALLAKMEHTFSTQEDLFTNLRRLGYGDLVAHMEAHLLKNQSGASTSTKKDTLRL